MQPVTGRQEVEGVEGVEWRGSPRRSRFVLVKEKRAAVLVGGRRRRRRIVLRKCTGKWRNGGRLLVIRTSVEPLYSPNRMSLNRALI